MAEIHLEQLVGRRVVDARGRHIGRIEEVRAERRDAEWIVGDYVLGIGGLVERLAAGELVSNVLGRLAREAERHTVPWDELDLTDPERPRTRHTLAELRRRAGQRGRRPTTER